jgi:hypothetical protein
VGGPVTAPVDSLAGNRAVRALRLIRTLERLSRTLEGPPITGDRQLAQVVRAMGASERADASLAAELGTPASDATWNVVIRVLEAGDS